MPVLLHSVVLAVPLVVVSAAGSGILEVRFAVVLAVCPASVSVVGRR